MQLLVFAGNASHSSVPLKIESAAQDLNMNMHTSATCPDGA